MAKTLLLALTLLLTSATTSTGQLPNCTSVQQKLQALSEAIEDLCGSTTPAPPSQIQCNCSHFESWTSVPLTAIGSTNLQHAGTLAYTIPSVIPSNAVEVLVYASVRCGYSAHITQDIKIYTQQGTRRYEKYLFMTSWPQSAYNTNSDNMWFPMATNRRIYMEISRAHGNNCGGYLKAIGYR